MDLVAREGLAHDSLPAGRVVDRAVELHAASAS